MLNSQVIVRSEEPQQKNNCRPCLECRIYCCCSVKPLESFLSSPAIDKYLSRDLSRKENCNLHDYFYPAVRELQREQKGKFEAVASDMLYWIS